MVRGGRKKGRREREFDEREGLTGCEKFSLPFAPLLSPLFSPPLSFLLFFSFCCCKKKKGSTIIIFFPSGIAEAEKERGEILLPPVAPAAAAEELDVGDLGVPYLPRLEVERDVDLDLQPVAPVVFLLFLCVREKGGGGIRCVSVSRGLFSFLLCVLPPAKTETKKPHHTSSTTAEGSSSPTSPRCLHTRGICEFSGGGGREGKKK